MKSAIITLAVGVHFSALCCAALAQPSPACTTEPAETIVLPKDGTSLLLLDVPDGPEKFDCSLDGTLTQSSGDGSLSVVDTGISNRERWKRVKYGFLVHYAWDGGEGVTPIRSDGSKPKNINELADEFDAPGFARDLTAMGVEYLIFFRHRLRAVHSMQKHPADAPQPRRGDAARCDPGFQDARETESQSMKTLFSILGIAATCLVQFAQATPLKAFHPGPTWPDNDGNHINAHGGGILHHEGVYYWFGQHMIAGDGNSHDHANWANARFLAEATN